MISAEEMAYRSRILARTQRWADIQMPKLLRSVLGQRLGPLPLIEADSEEVATVAAPAPVTPIPDPPLRALPNTGAMPKLRDTAMISAIQLLKPDIRKTRELVSSAVSWFYEKHGSLPTTVALSPMRCLGIEKPDFFVVDCTTNYMVDGEEITVELCYTVSIESKAHLNSDVVQLRGLRRLWEKLEDVYL